jgi:hypothetical protein
LVVGWAGASLARAGDDGDFRGGERQRRLLGGGRMHSPSIVHRTPVQGRWDDWEGHNLRPEGLGPKELLDIATWHTSGEEVVEAIFIRGDDKMAHGRSHGGHHPKPPAKVPKVAKMGNSSTPQWVVVTTSYNNADKKAGGSDKEYIMVDECDFKRQAQQSNDHFEKLVEEACLNHV